MPLLTALFASVTLFAFLPWSTAGIVPEIRQTVMGVLAAVFLVEAVGVSLRDLRARLRRRLRARPHGGVTEYEPGPVLRARLERLARRAGRPAPRLRILALETPDAASDSRRNTIWLSAGLIARLTPAELDAVMAHELAHLVDSPSVLMLLAAPVGLAVTTGTALGALLAFADPGAAVLAAACAVFAAGVAAAHLVLFAHRRRSEFAADRLAASWVAPQALAAALRRLEGADVTRAPGRVDPAAWLAGLFHSHPAAAARIHALTARAA